MPRWTAKAVVKLKQDDGPHMTQITYDFSLGRADDEEAAQKIFKSFALTFSPQTTIISYETQEDQYAAPESYV